MARTLVHVGFGNMIVAERIVAIIQPASSPVKRLKEEARAAGRLIDIYAARIRKAHRARSLVKRLAGRIVARAADHLKIGIAVYPYNMRVAA